MASTGERLPSPSVGGGEVGSASAEQNETSREDNIKYIESRTFAELKSRGVVWGELSSMSDEELAALAASFRGEGNNSGSGAGAGAPAPEGAAGSRSESAGNSSPDTSNGDASMPPVPPVVIPPVGSQENNGGSYAASAVRAERKYQSNARRRRIGAAALAVVAAAGLLFGAKFMSSRVNPDTDPSTSYSGTAENENSGERIILDQSGYVGFVEDGIFAVQLDDGEVVSNPEKTSVAELELMELFTCLLVKLS